MLLINEINPSTLRVEDVLFLFHKGHYALCENGKAIEISLFRGFNV